MERYWVIFKVKCKSYLFLLHHGKIQVLEHQHEFHLYTYQPIENIPDGTVVLDANEIMPESEVFKLKDHYLPFSDIWRYWLLYKKGGIWVDMDMVCVSDMIDIIDTPFIFSSERTIQRGAYRLEAEYVANIGFLKYTLNDFFNSLELEDETMTKWVEQKEIPHIIF